MPVRRRRHRTRSAWQARDLTVSSAHGTHGFGCTTWCRGFLRDPGGSVFRRALGQAMDRFGERVEPADLVGCAPPASAERRQCPPCDRVHWRAPSFYRRLGRRRRVVAGVRQGSLGRSAWPPGDPRIKSMVRCAGAGPRSSVTPRRPLDINPARPRRLIASRRGDFVERSSPGGFPVSDATTRSTSVQTFLLPPKKPNGLREMVPIENAPGTAPARFTTACREESVRGITSFNSR